MKINDLLKELRENKVSISLNGENLSLKFDQRELPQELLVKIRLHKADIINYLKKNDETANLKSGIVPIPESEDGYDLSSAQQRFWILSQLEDGLASYNITNQVELNGTYNIEVFKRAVFAAIDRHEILRTLFKKNSKGEIRQWIMPMEDLEFSIAYHDLTQEANPLDVVSAFIIADTGKPFDLENAPLLRAALLQIAADKYVFHYNLHHIIGDGWSIGVLANDVLAYYNSFLNEEQVKLPPLEIHYKDYAAWQLKELSGNKNKKQKEYWLNVLEGELPLTDLPSDKVRPVIKTQNGATLECFLSRELTNQLKAFTKEKEGSLFITLLALWESLIYLYTGQSDLITGSPVAGRDHADLENQIGCFVNTVIFRDKIKTGDSFLEHYNRVKQNALQVYEHQMYPFDQLIEELNPKRYMNRNAIFDIMVVLLNTGKNWIDSTIEMDAEIIDKGLHPAKFDMEVNFAEAGSYLCFRVHFNTDVYEKQMVESLMQHFRQMATKVLNNPETILQTIELISAEEKTHILDEFNKTATVFESSGTVIDLFSAQEQLFPDKTAVVFQDTALTYKQLDEASSQFAHYLVSHFKITNNDLVGIKLYRSEWMIITILGILKAGAVYVPIAPENPEERLAYLKKDSGYRVCIDEVALENFKVIRKNYPVSPLKTQIAATDGAYAIYTSGSTGQPKGVLNHHEGLTNRLLWMKAYLNVSDKDIILQKTPYTFDVSVWELLLPFISGAKLVFAIPEGHKDPYYLQAIIDRERVSIIHFVPSMLKVFLNNLESASKSLKHVICSGEALPAAVVNEFKTKLKCRIHNLYGPTEAAIDVTAIDLTNYDTSVKGVTIGYPIANTNMYIVNEAMIVQPVGVAGELLIGGIQVAHGYLNKKELTADKFIESPFKKNERLYKTGDIAKWNNDGSITYLGRRDSQVKIRGHRIELDEVATQLSSHPELKEAVVCVKKNAELEHELVAYVVSDKTQTSSSLRKFLAGKLPDYEIPAYFIQLETLPVSANGKLDEKALPSPDSMALTSNVEYVAPRNETEEKLVEIFAMGLGRKPKEIGINDNFFDLGANSIKLIKILNDINVKMKTAIKPVHLFQYANISDLVKNVFYTGTEEEEDEEENNLLSEELDSIIDLMED